MTALKRGFTLIELLIVMAILGVLAVVVLVAINPAEQMRRARDTGRISGTQQLGRAVQAYFTANGVLPGSGVAPATGSVGTDLTTSQELSALPSEIVASGETTGCTGGQPISNTWCYKFTAPTTFVVYARLWSQQRISQCTGSGSQAYSIFSSTASRGGIFCGNDEPNANSSPTL